MYLNDTGARMLLSDDIYDEMVGGVAVGLPCPPLLVSCPGSDASPGETLVEFLTPDRPPLAPPRTSREDMAFWLYTSGTTGRPKAVVHAHRDVEIADLHLTRNLCVQPGERVFATSKLFFAYALGHSVLGALKCGATAILHPGWPDASSVAEVIEATRPDLVLSVPTLYRNLLREGLAGRDRFRRVRHYVSAGEALPAKIYNAWRDLTGRAILEGIGTSETTFLFIANTPDAHRAGRSGRVVPWAEVELRGASGVPVSTPGESGIGWVRMGSLFTEYWDEPDRTRATRDGDWYRTDDVFSVDEEGWWTYHGRYDDQLKVSGQWVSPVDVEQAALELPAIADAGVVGMTDADGLVQIVLLPVAAPGEVAGDDLSTRILAQLRDCLPHHQCPRLIQFVDEIPRTATGKIQRYKLRDLVMTRGPG